jgi:hypothetical protein
MHPPDFVELAQHCMLDDIDHHLASIDAQAAHQQLGVGGAPAAAGYGEQQGLQCSRALVNSLLQRQFLH